MKNRVGSPVEGEDFFDREREQAAIWRHLDGSNLLLLAPRRVGKTSLMKRLVSDAQGYRALYITVEGATDEADFVQRLYRAVAEHHPAVTRQLLEKAKESPLGTTLKRVNKLSAWGVSVQLSDAASTNWPDAIRTLGSLLSGLDTPWLFAIDELPLFILKLLREDPSAERAGAFLHNLRELRQNQPRLRWILAGSIGLDTVTSRHSLADTINDLRLTSLGPFSEQSAAAFLLALAGSYQISLNSAQREYLLQRLEWLLPYYIQLLFSEILDQAADPNWTADPDQIDQIFENLLQPANKNYFDYWRQRLHEELGSPDDIYAVALLNSACQIPSSSDAAGVTKQTLSSVLSRHVQNPDERDQRLRYLLDILVNDGYLVETSGRYAFRFPLLREYWQRRVAE